MEELANRHPRKHPPPPGPYPWLVFYHGKGLRNQTFHSITEPNNTYVRSIPELRGKKVCASFHGWLIMCQKQDQYSLLNPDTLEFIDLPPLKLKPNQLISECVLSSSPHSPNSRILLFDNNTKHIIFYRIGDKDWIFRPYMKEINEIGDHQNKSDAIRRPVSCKGKIYATTFTLSKLLLIDIIEPNELVIRWLQIELPCVLNQLSICTRKFLVESCDELFTIHILFGGVSYETIIAMEVNKLDWTSMIWVKVESAKDRTFFLDWKSGISCHASDQSNMHGGCIYITLGDRSLYSYNIEDASLSVCLPCPNLPTPWESTGWIMPNISKVCELSRHTKLINDQEGQRKEAIEVKERDNTEKTVDETRGGKQTQLFDLPFDTLVYIAGLLILVDYMNFRIVCKMSRLVAPPLKWRTKLGGLETNIMCPWLVILEKEKGAYTFVDPKFGGRYFITIPEVLEGATIWYAKDGWLMMLRGRQTTQAETIQTVFFFNPFTGSIIQYPDLIPSGGSISSFCFSSSPTSSDCTIVGIASLYRVVVISVITSEDEEWSYLEFKNNLPFEPNHNSLVYHEGAFYSLGQHGNLGVFKIGEEGTSWEVLDKPKRPCSSFYENYLVDFDGELLSVFVGSFGKWVQVFKLIHRTMVWVKVESLGNHKLYVSRTSCLAALSRTTDMQDIIYFPRFSEQSIIFYSLPSGKYHSFGSKDSLVNHYNTMQHLYCGWIEPRWF